EVIVLEADPLPRALVELADPVPHVDFLEILALHALAAGHEAKPEGEKRPHRPPSDTALCRRGQKVDGQRLFSNTARLYRSPKEGPDGRADRSPERDPELHRQGVGRARLSSHDPRDRRGDG